MVEPLACCLHGVERAESRPGETVAILGAGPIGLMLCACVARRRRAPVARRRASRSGARSRPQFGAVPGDGRTRTS